MKTTLSKVLLGRVVIEFLVLLLVFVAVDEMTAPSESTRAALQDAVNKQLLDPAPLVEVTSAIHAASSLTFVLWIIRLVAVFLLCSDLWMLWRSRRETQPSPSPK